MNQPIRTIGHNSRYQILKCIGRGGMGFVWQGYDTELEREVAVKEVIIPSTLKAEARSQALERADREARAIASLDHPGVVTIHDIFREDEQLWIIMQLIKAPSLDKIIEERGALPPAEAAIIGLQLLQIIRVIHAHKIIHRDIKPSNVLVREDGRIVLVDFGIAAIEGDPTLTDTGAILGSPSYMSPERARAQRATPASDLWSLGATLYAIVEGHPPYRGTSPQATLELARKAAPIKYPNADTLKPVLQRLLCKEPGQRLTPNQATRLLEEAAQPKPEQIEDTEEVTHYFDPTGPPPPWRSYFGQYRKAWLRLQKTRYKHLKDWFELHPKISLPLGCMGMLTAITLTMVLLVLLLIWVFPPAAYHKPGPGSTNPSSRPSNTSTDLPPMIP